MRNLEYFLIQEEFKRPWWLSAQHDINNECALVELLGFWFLVSHVPTFCIGGVTWTVSSLSLHIIQYKMHESKHAKVYRGHLEDSIFQRHFTVT